MKVKVKEKKLDYWEALPMPRKWRVVENSGGEGEEQKQEMAKSVMNEWLSVHPMDGG